ncbi:Pentatricopeptide repeat-containing protein [Seminavis robusta]|uniref:Pentatricopeptide repeat-containing protein n=1 Tax=Seminavis robusta TaxID=568900 RepID=A0A9N8DBR3_9STRA|nr:Pentatricopeptide repeat-containing protein [Seminavis robusta]|eukprot:Sro75_g041300.1 Pentatricopeptide repeat-containing protein (808) ;mRNA; r:77686-80293
MRRAWYSLGRQYLRHTTLPESRLAPFSSLDCQRLLLPRPKSQNNDFPLQCFSTTPDPSLPPKVVVSSRPRHSNSPKEWKRAEQEANRILEGTSTNQAAGMVALQVKELLIRMVNLPRHAEKGPLADRLLSHAQTDLNRSNYRHREDLRAKLYQLTIEAWLDTFGGRKTWDEAERLLWELLNNADEAKQQIDRNRFYCLHNLQNNVKNINEAFAMVLFHFCKHDGKQQRRRRNRQQLTFQTKSRLEPLVQTMQRLWGDPVVPLVPDSLAMDAVLYYYFCSGQADLAYETLQGIIQEADTNPFLRPTLHGINTVISALAKEGKVDKAKEIITQMLQENSSNKLPKPEVVSFNGLLNAIAQRGGRDAGQETEEVLDWMIQHAIKPNTISYSTVISAWSKSGHADAAERSEAILRQCLELNLLAGGDATFLFSMVVQAWSRTGRPDRAVAVVDLMSTIYNDDKPKQEMTHVFNSLIMAVARTGQDENNMHAKLMKFLDQMEDLGIPADAVTHNSIMTAMIQNGKPVEALEYFYNLEEKIRADRTASLVDSFSYNIALDAMSKCKGEDAPRLALELLERMTKAQDIADVVVEATTATYNTVMKILAKSSLEDSALRCEQLLKAMEERSVSSISRPDAISYSTCITAWGYTRLPEKYDRMSQLLRRMEASYQSGNRAAQPNAIPFNTVLIGCLKASSDDRETALDCILGTLNHLRRAKVRPNPKTYPLVFRGIALNCKGGERRDSLLLNEFEKCAKDGLVSAECLTILGQASPQLLGSRLPEEMADVVGGLDMNKIPVAWRKNTTTVGSEKRQ